MLAPDSLQEEVVCALLFEGPKREHTLRKETNDALQKIELWRVWLTRAGLGNLLTYKEAEFRQFMSKLVLEGKVRAQRTLIREVCDWADEQQYVQTIYQLAPDVEVPVQEPKRELRFA